MALIILDHVRMHKIVLGTSFGTMMTYAKYETISSRSQKVFIKFALQFHFSLLNPALDEVLFELKILFEICLERPTGMWTDGKAEDELL